MAVVKYWFLVAISLLSGAAWADAREELAGLLKAHTGLTASFEQRITGERGDLLERSTGRVALMRPYFRWEVIEPFPQLLVSDGERLQIYDPDLAQLTVRPIDQALDDTPLSVLTRHEVVLDERFDVGYTEEGFVLRPLADDALFAEVILSFTDQRLSGLTIRDHLGQETHIRFDEVQLDAMLQSGDFELEVPPGTDVVEG